MNIIRSLIQKAKDFFFGHHQQLTEEIATVFCQVDVAQNIPPHRQQTRENNDEVISIYSSDDEQSISRADIFFQGLYRVKSKDDGNCFYYSIAATLNVESGRERYTQQQLRDKVRDFWLQQIRCDGEYLRVLRLAVIEWLEQVRKVNTDNPNKQHMLAYIDEIKNTRKWANESAVLALALSLDRPIITLVPAHTGASVLEVYNKSGIISTKGLPIFVYYNKQNHYDALLVQRGFKLVEVAQIICPNWQKEREILHNHDDTINISSSEDESVCSSAGGKQRQIKRPVIINNKKRLLTQDEATSIVTINSKKLKRGTEKSSNF